MVEGIRFIEKMKANPVDKDAVAAQMAPFRNLFTKSVVTRADLPEGAVLEKEHLTLKKPGTGIPATRLKDVIGRRLKHKVAADTLLSEDDLG